MAVNLTVKAVVVHSIRWASSMLHEITRNPKVQAAFVGKTIGASDEEKAKLAKSAETRKASAYELVDVITKTKEDYLSEASIDYFVECLKSDDFDKCNLFTLMAMLKKMSDTDLGETTKVSQKWYDTLRSMDMFEAVSIAPVYNKRSMKKGVKKTEGFEIIIHKRDGSLMKETFYKKPDGMYKISKLKKLI